MNAFRTHSVVAAVLILGLGGAAWAETPDLRSVPADLAVPALTDGPPAAGQRVKQWLPDYKGTNLYHVLYLPTDWKPGARYPVLVEYAGNGNYKNKYGDISEGVPEGSKLGYGISGGKGFIWVCLPYVNPGHDGICIHWWGDVAATLEYCKKAVRRVCEEYGGDPSAVILTGFSRGAIACSYLGLHDEEIAKLWRAFIPYSHYDGMKAWPYPEADAASAYARMKRLGDRPTFFVHEGTAEGVRKFLDAGGVKAPFTLQQVPFRNHNDEWILRDTPARTALRAWLAEVLKAPAPPTDPSALISVRADRKLFRLSDRMIGANMEDLHYQMVGGISSQLIHGESFFEPSPTQLAATSARVEGFTHCGGQPKVENGELFLPKGMRLTTVEHAKSDIAEARIAMQIPAAGNSWAGLAVCVSPNNSDNAWEWYSGYTVWVAADRVVLTRAEKANKHLEVAKAAVSFKPGQWVQNIQLISCRGVVLVHVGGKKIIDFTDPHPLPTGHMAVVAHSGARVRDVYFSPSLGCKPTFEENPLLKIPGDAISLRWKKVQTGSAAGDFALVSEGRWLPNCPGQTITFRGGEGEWGIDNMGLQRWGIAVHDGKPYEGFLRVKSVKPTELWVTLRSADGKKILAEKMVTTAGTGQYEGIGFALTPAGDDPAGRFAITLRRPGSITLGYVFLQPGEWGRYKGLPVRKDLAEALLAQGIHVLRFNGGMIERPDYRWKNMRGPRDRRPPYDGFYDRYCSNGFGVAEAVALGEAMGIPVIPALNIDETPEEVADFIAYCVAPADTPAGARRAADGHPKPYPLPYYQVANESHFDAKYVQKFKQVAQAVWKVAPDITLITTSTRPRYKETDSEAAVRKAMALHLDLAQFVQQQDKTLMFDSHDFGGAAPVPLIADFARRLKTFAPRAKVEVGILEFNAGAFDFQRGLSHALETNAAYRHGDAIRAVGTPNVSQPWGVYQTDWKAVLWTQGNIYYTPAKVWFQAAYYVDQMTARHWAPNVVACDVTAPKDTLDVLAATTDDGKLVLRVVNGADRPVAAQLKVAGLTPRQPAARVETLAGEPRSFNTLEEPDKIKPVASQWKHEFRDGKASCIFPANSFTILTLE